MSGVKRWTWEELKDKVANGNLVEELDGCCTGMQPNDAVDAPIGYTSGDIECVDALRSALTPEEFRGHVKAAVIEYCWRERLKGGDEDLKKARKWLDLLFSRSGGV